MLERVKIWTQTHPRWQFPIRVLHAGLSGKRPDAKGRRLKSENDKIVLIVGSGRSGNTLLRRLLIENLSIYIPPESYVLGPIVSSTIFAKSLPWPEIVELTLGQFVASAEFETFEFDKIDEVSAHCKAWPKSKQTVGNIVVQFYQDLGRDKGIASDWIGDKTPLNTLNLGLMAKMFPNASYIYLERDGVDVVNSYVKSGLYSRLEDASMRWRQSLKAWHNFKRTLPSNRMIEVNYEALVQDHQKVIQSIAHDFGIAHRSKTINISNTLGDVSARAHHAEVEKPVSTASIGKGRRELTAIELARIAPILNNSLQKSGYEPL